MSHTTTLTLGTVPMVVEYEYFSGESQTFEHPGSPAEVEVVGVFIGEHEVSEFLGESTTDRIEEMVRNQHGSEVFA